MIKLAIKRLINSVWVAVYIEIPNNDGNAAQLLVHTRDTNLGVRAEIGYSVPCFNIVEDGTRNAIALEIFNDVDSPVPDKILPILNSANVFHYPNSQRYGDFLSVVMQDMLLASLLEDGENDFYHPPYQR